MIAPNLVLVYEDNREKEILNRFLDAINNDKLSVEVKEIPPMGPMMGVHWLMPTAAFLFITQSYFNSFFNEMGKDHYNILKNELIELKDDFFGEDAPKRVLVTSSSSQNKVNESANKYSLDFSIMAEANNGNRFKLLIPKEISNKEYTSTIICFLEFLKKYNNNEIDEISNEFIFSKTILITYNSDSDNLEFVNPFNRD